MERKTKSIRAGAKNKALSSPNTVRLYELDVFLIGGPITPKFAKKNRVISRTILIRGDQTLADLHHAIFQAYGRWEEHLYEFQFGKWPMDPKALRYVLPSAFKVQSAKDKPPAGRVDLTTIESLRLEVDDRFGYWFDFGEDWWHQINVENITPAAPKGTYPIVIKRRGENPPQYPPEGEDS
jgi:Plasmid pRiA4b ORF-3-like protein